jgi:hypothetical protein
MNKINVGVKEMTESQKLISCKALRFFADEDQRLKDRYRRLEQLFEEYKMTLSDSDDDESYTDSRNLWKSESDAFLRWLRSRG